MNRKNREESDGPWGNLQAKWIIIIIIIMYYYYYYRLLWQVFFLLWCFSSWASGEPHHSGFKSQLVALSLWCVMFLVWQFL
jgi:hypothetical protein